MNPSRRQFLKASLTASAAAALASKVQAASASGNSSTGNREFYELGAYRLKPEASHALLDGYLEKALIPALNKRGIATVGVFNEDHVEPRSKDGPAVWVLIPHASLDSFVAVSASLNADPEVQKAGAEYLESPKANPAFDRIDTSL